MIRDSANPIEGIQRGIEFKSNPIDLDWAVLEINDVTMGVFMKRITQILTRDCAGEISTWFSNYRWSGSVRLSMLTTG